jgi:hypothetical protein
MFGKYKGRLLGIAISIIMTGYRVVYPAQGSIALGELMLYGGIVVAFICFASIGWDWGKHQLPLPQCLPSAIRAWLAWRSYHPVISDPVQFQTAGNPTLYDTMLGQIFITLPVESFFPYGQTTVDFNGSYAQVKQGSSRFKFEIQRKPNTEIRIGKPETHGIALDYFIEQASTETKKFDPSAEFRWKIDGVLGALQFEDGTSVGGKLAAIRGRKKGTRKL